MDQNSKNILAMGLNGYTILPDVFTENDETLG